MLSLQASLFEAKEQVFALQQENRELSEKVRRYEERALEREKYELKLMGHGAAVVPKGKAEPLYCPNCFDPGKLSVLGATGLRSSSLPSHVCGVCESRLASTRAPRRPCQSLPARSTSVITQAFFLHEQSITWTEAGRRTEETCVTPVAPDAGISYGIGELPKGRCLLTKLLQFPVNTLLGS